jgi:hypothetical protein
MTVELQRHGPSLTVAAESGSSSNHTILGNEWTQTIVCACQTGHAKNLFLLQYDLLLCSAPAVAPESSGYSKMFRAICATAEISAPKRACAVKGWSPFKTVVPVITRETASYNNQPL